jgi:glutamate N-acetyltransferase / amino-acid N-acetyltransferase
MSTIHLPKGYRASAVKTGIKPSGGLDLALIVADVPGAAAGTFTTNRVAAAPVRWCRELIPSDRVQAIVINAGNANAATGEQGYQNARRTAEIVGDKLGCGADGVLIASTGVIGRQLPMDRLEEGLPLALAGLSAEPSAFEEASRAIMTTDTRPKVVSRRVPLECGKFTIFGMAKGAAMIGPKMATMLGFLLTDARIAPGALQGILAEAVDASFNCITVEGHTSTNDTVLFLAGSNSDRPFVRGDDLKAFSAAVKETCIELAMMIPDDGEGATHRITVDVRGCRDRAEAETIARSVAEDVLVKTAIHGADPNWGRIVSAAGHAGILFDEPEMSLRLNGVPLYAEGAPLPFDAAALSGDIRANRETRIELTFTRGTSAVRFWTCDLTAEYIRLNADYTT